MPDPMKNSRPLNDFTQDTTRVLKQLKRTGKPLLLTVSGRGRVVVQDQAAYRKMMALADEAAAIRGIKLGLRDVAAGRTQPALAALKKLGAKLGIPGSHRRSGAA